MLGSTTSIELKRLLTAGDVAAKIGHGYTVRPIFVSNVAADASGRPYIGIAISAGAELDVWDLERLAPVLEQLDRDWFVPEEVHLAMSPGKFFVDGPRRMPTMVVAVLPALELVKLPGIGDTRAFAQNVRLGLGGTRVNQEITRTVQAKPEHVSFLTFHNGLTVVAKSLSVRSNRIRMKDFSVCNGCQSLVILHAQRAHLTSDLELLVRFVRVGDDRDLAASISYRTNNQNPVSLRDQSANDAVQVQLQAEYDSLFGPGATYGIKASATRPAGELPNEQAGQMLLALYNGQPWSAHQKYRVFGDLKEAIWRYGIAASHVRLAQLLSIEAGVAVRALSNERVRKYGLTRFLVLYLIGEVLREEPDGRSLLDSPGAYLEQGAAGRTRQAAVLDQVRRIAADIVIELDDYLKTAKTGFDYKSEFKSEASIQQIRSEVVKAYAKDKRRSRATVFALPK